MDLKIEKQLLSKKVELESQLNSVFGQVIYNWKMKARNCSLKGKNFANLFFFNKPEESDLFFIKNELYEKMQLEPPFLRLEAKNGILLAQISWEKYFEEEKTSVIQDVDIEI